MLYYIIQIFKGILIGIGAILPGVSSGVLCVVFGIYEKLLNSVLCFFSNIKENIKFLLPLLIGIFIGIVLFGNALNYIFTHFKIPAYSLFAGLILGSIPSILKEANIKKISSSSILILLLTLSISIYLVVMETFSSSYKLIQTSFASLVFVGFAMSAGVVIPGISSTVILMLLGKYEIYLSAISSLDFIILIPMGIGIILGSLLLLQLIRLFLTYFRTLTYFAIIGFVLGSLPVLIPSISSKLDFFCGLISFIIGLFIGLFFNKITSNNTTKEVL